MSPSDPNAGMDRTHELMMRALDGEITEAQKAELEALITKDDSANMEWERLLKLKETTAALRLKQPPDELWEDYMDSVYRRVERGIGWILVSVGVVVLFSYGLWQLVSELIGDVTIPWYVKGGTLALLVGFVILAVSVIREKYFVYKDDPYRNVYR